MRPSRGLALLLCLLPALANAGFIIDVSRLGDEPRFFASKNFGFGVFTALPAYGETDPLLLYTGTAATPGICPYDEYDYCSGRMELRFRRPVENLTFTMYGWENDDYAHLSLYGSTGLIANVDACQDPRGDCNGGRFSYPVDLSGYHGIERLVFDVGDLSGGVLFNHFSAEVPEPWSLSLLGAALLGLGLSRRRSV